MRIFATRLALGACLLGGVAAAQSAKISVVVDKPGIQISPMLYGIFFEEINRAGEGGLYAEMVQNRSFEDAPTPLGWSMVISPGAQGSMSLDHSSPLNSNNPTSLKLEITSVTGGRVGIANQGFKGAPYSRERTSGPWMDAFNKAVTEATSGLPVHKGKQYRFSCYARSGGQFSTPLTVAIEQQNGTVLASATIDSLGQNWQKCERMLTASATDPDARLVVSAASPGALWLDMVSLFPVDTFKQRPNGMRADLAQMIQNMKPAFVRFPGGCFVEGDELANAWRWKKTIGDVAQRSGHYNLWGYYSGNGLGYFEYLQFCEDINAKPLLVINCGMSHKEQRIKEAVQVPDLDEYVQDALDAIEYAIGPSDSKWGARRAQAGHPQPFPLEFIEIGNENHGPTYEAHYQRFYDAIKARYPKMNLVANAPTTSRPTQINDEHYYNSPGFFLRQAGKYDNYDRSKWKVYVGEYAVTQYAGLGNLTAAIGEAAFMTGMERNSDVVIMSSYAPLFVFPAWKRWNPNAIVFDASRAYGTPSYHVQAMFAQNRADVVLPTQVESPAIEDQASAAGMIGVGTWRTQAEFKDIRVTHADKVLFASDFAQGLKGWKPRGGKWRVQDAALQQISDEQPATIFAGNPQWRDYTLSLKARKLGGDEGFLISIRAPNDRVKSWWNIGGWGNHFHGLEIGGNQTEKVPGRIQTGRWYDIRIEIQGGAVKCYLDGTLIQEAAPARLSSLYAVAGKIQATGEIVLKMVNAASFAQDTLIELRGVGQVASSAKAVVLTSPDGEDENSFDKPNLVSPRSFTMDVAGPGFRQVLPPNSVTVLRLATRSPAPAGPR